MKTTRSKLLSIINDDSCEEFNNIIKNLIKENYLMYDKDEFAVPDNIYQRISECTSNQLKLLETIGIAPPKQRRDIIHGVLDILDINEVKAKDFVPYLNPVNREQLQHNALSWLRKIVKAYNGDRKIDWKNHSQYKYLPYRYWDTQTSRWVVGVCRWCSGADCEGGLYFVDIKDAEDAVKKFRDIYDDYWNE